MNRDPLLWPELGRHHDALVAVARGQGARSFPGLVLHRVGPNALSTARNWRNAGAPFFTCLPGLTQSSGALVYVAAWAALEYDVALHDAPVGFRPEACARYFQDLASVVPLQVREDAGDVYLATWSLVALADVRRHTFPPMAPWLRGRYGGR